MNRVTNWFAVYTKPRWEKKVDGVLIKKGINSWCPVQKVEKKWSDRKKIVEEPLFRSYVFVNITEDERLSVLQTGGVLNFVHYLGKPAIIKNEEIELIKSYLLEKNTTISILPLQQFKENDKVVVKQGVFMDNTGTVIRQGNKKVYVKLESLGQVMVVEFPVSYVALSND
ncbi:MAG TPA: UpxY family transcription antiterminator [Chitinophagaceae bacterium]|nr:UpxY family transcription antiterminator [Chitinophagaceae bacterium]